MHKKRTKIVCTIGPASSSEDVLRALIMAGMNMARLNFSHGKHEAHAEFIRHIRELSVEVREPVAILQDLQGPKIRAGELPEDGIELVAGSEVVFTTGEPAIEDMRLPVTYDRLHDDVKPGERILMDDGLLSAEVVSVQGKDVTCKIIDGGILKSHKGINLPETKVSISSITEKDKKDLRFGISERVDWVALSFVRSADAVRELKALIREYRNELGIDEHDVPVRVIAKIEKREAVDAIDEILDEVDAIMVARGDLGIELPAEEVPVIQKNIIRKCLSRSKPVVVATQMLDSMIRNPRPTRAEVSDVANAVIDHADGVMLSGETAMGEHPVEAVEIMAKVALETEDSEYDDLDPKSVGAEHSVPNEMAEIASLLASDLGAKAVLVLTVTGDSARSVSRFRPEIPIFAVTRSERVKNQLAVSWGVEAFTMDAVEKTDEPERMALAYLKEKGHLERGDKVIVVGEMSVPAPDAGGRVEVREIS